MEEGGLDAVKEATEDTCDCDCNDKAVEENPEVFEDCAEGVAEEGLDAFEEPREETDNCAEEKMDDNLDAVEEGTREA